MPSARFLLLYCSATGKAQSIAELIADQAHSYGFEADLQCVSGYGKKVCLAFMSISGLVVHEHRTAFA